MEENAPRLVTTCSSGVTAYAITMAAYLPGNKDSALYDGSWTERGNNADNALPVHTGPFPLTNQHTT